MKAHGFETPIEEGEGGALMGPWRSPQQMLAEQSYDGHVSIHDDAMAQKHGFKGGTIEGPTHFSQFVPLCVAHWGEDFLKRGRLSAHYRSPVYPGERVRAFLTPTDGEGPSQAGIRMERDDGTEILRGTASIGPGDPPSALERRMVGLERPADLVILRDVPVGWRSGRVTVRMDPDQDMGRLYPFSLTQKLAKITEPSTLYEGPRGQIPFEMISVLLNGSSLVDPMPSRGPAVGLFADQEIRLINGPLYASTDYEMDREVVALSGSRRTESAWVLTRVYPPGSDEVLATMLLNTATLKASYARYDEELAALSA